MIKGQLQERTFQEFVMIKLDLPRDLIYDEFHAVFEKVVTYF
ncbi:MAG: hypothetical protein BAJALOKI2v1_70024 [Promethearchaeota archaeon]|nr:MAG: hypothetical protein BAJALOKI2v1_70024 [Candidatus Lokiarchaeota archaeon]